ncbi:MAG: response regulator [Nitrospiraceae bacterium]|nr:MAG: response regulator [Nitrospiraceae bacterium]
MKMKKVIIAEDIWTSLKKDDSFLNRSDVKTFMATANEEILAFHRAEKANLIITNLDMPGMDGEHLCSLIRDDAALRRVSIIIVCPETAENLRRCEQCDANAFIATPVNSAVLLQEAYRLLHVTPRKSCRISVKLTIEGTSKEKPFTGHIENISASGMLFLSPEPLFEGDTLKCSFSLPGLSRIVTVAEIVRVMKKEDESEPLTRYGVIFPDISDNDIYIIEKFVDYHADQCPSPDITE